MIMMLAQALGRKEQLRAMQQRFSEPDPSAGWHFLFIIILVIWLVALAWIINRWQQRRKTPAMLQPMALFGTVLRKLGLSFLERWRLRQVARAASLEHPTALLISPQVYDEAVQTYFSGQGWLGSRSGEAEPLRAIRRRLFAVSGESS